MGRGPSWTDYEKELIRDTIIDYREAGKPDQSALSALLKVMTHRNGNALKTKFREIASTINEVTIVHEVADEHVVDFISQIDQIISHLESVSEELQSLRQADADLKKILDAVNTVRH